MSRACKPVLVGVVSPVSEIWLPFKNSQISLSTHGLPYSAKFSRAVNFADFANSNSIAKIIFVKITIFDLLRPKLILTCVVNKKTRPAHVKMAVPRALLK